MEKKVKVMIEITEKEMPLIQAYCEGLANGALDPDSLSGDDWDELRDVCKNHTPELKSVLYQLTGETLKAVGQFFRDARVLSSKHESVYQIAREAEDWAAEILGYKSTEDNDETEEAS